MSEPFLSEIRIFSFPFAPKGWTLCNGQLLPINSNQPLFSLLGTTYGGDGRVNFGLPNLQARVPISMNAGFVLGELGGEQSHTLTIAEIPLHTHTWNCSNSNANIGAPTGTLQGSTTPEYDTSTSSLVAMRANALGNVGGSQAHVNMQPYLVLNMCIALQGIFPSQT